jgi:hypothetical protein
MEDIMKIPDEVLMKILAFVPNRFDVAPVCKKFYELICKIDENKYKLKVGAFHNEVSEA